MAQKNWRSSPQSLQPGQREEIVEKFVGDGEKEEEKTTRA